MNKSLGAFLLALLVVLAAAIGCSQQGTSGNETAVNTAGVAVPGFEDFTLGAAVQEGGLTMIPVLSRPQDEQDLSQYVLLGEAKKAGWIEIEEVDDEYATVEALAVTYTGPRPLFLMAGELLLGGKQDRVVAKDVVIQPGETVDVPVFCVEPGRWSGSMHFEPQDGQVPIAVKEQAIAGSQQGVWSKVGEYNAAAAPSANGSSLRHGYSASQESGEYQTALDRILKQFKDRNDVVGVVIVIGGRVQSFEYFDSPSLFASAFESIARGALASSSVVKGRFARPEEEEIASFVTDSLKSLDKAGYDGYNASSGVDLMMGAYVDAEDDKVIHGTFFNQKK